MRVHPSLELKHERKNRLCLLSGRRYFGQQKPIPQNTRQDMIRAACVVIPSDIFYILKPCEGLFNKNARDRFLGAFHLLPQHTGCWTRSQMNTHTASGQERDSCFMRGSRLRYAEFHYSLDETKRMHAILPSTHPDHHFSLF